MSALAAGSAADRNTAAILTALRLVNPAATDENASAATRAPGTPALPTARARVAIDTFAAAGSYDEFNARRLNTKQLLGDVLSWHGTSRLTKPVNKAVLGSMSAVDEGSETSLYPQGVEMLSFLALCAPMLEPDRLARLAALAEGTANAYKPIRYLVTPAAQLRTILDRYNDNRKEQLLASLWIAAHEGRWWDTTAGTPARVHRRRRRHIETRDEEERAAIEEQVNALFTEGSRPTPLIVADAFESRLLTYSDDAARILGTMHLRDVTDHRVLTSHVDHPDADVPVLLSYVRQLLPDERPESPIPALIESLVADLGDEIDNPGTLPERPEEWSELYPAVSMEGFPLPNQVRSIEKMQLRGLAGAKVTMMRHAAMLRSNATHMGNCTFSYRRSCEDGTTAIGHLEWGQGEYNFALRSTAAAQPGTPARWTLGEVNSRFNRGQVPDGVRDALRDVLAKLNS